MPGLELPRQPSMQQGRLQMSPTDLTRFQGMLRHLLSQAVQHIKRDHQLKNKGATFDPKLGEIRMYLENSLKLEPGALSKWYADLKNMAFDEEASIEKPPQLQSDIGRLLWNDTKWTDAKVVSCERVFLVHLAVVCSASPVFDAAFSSGMQEGAIRQYVVTDAASSEVEIMLRFMYTGHFFDNGDAGLKEDVLLRLLPLAVYFQVNTLIERVAQGFCVDCAECNVGARASVLKKYVGHKLVSSAWRRFVSRVAYDENLVHYALLGGECSHISE